MKELQFTKELEFIPLKELLLEDNEEIKKLKSLYQKEMEYVSFLGPIESFIAYFYLDNPKIKDKNVIRAIKNIKLNYNKDLNFFNDYFEREFIGVISCTLQENKRKITRHELFLVLNYILWSIDNRKWIGEPRAYLNWICNFFGLFDKEEKNKFDNFYEELGKDYGLIKEKIKLLKNEDSDEEPSASDIALSKSDSEKFSNQEDELWSEGSYIKSINPDEKDFDEKMKYFEEKNNEEKEHNCKKCNKPIGRHNLYWHEGMCNDCFFDKYNM